MITKNIVGFDGYSLTEDGRVYSEKRKCFLKPWKNKNTNYHCVGLSKKNGSYAKNTKKLLHIAMMEAFVGPRPEGLQIAHLDGNKSNNHISNLKYVTVKENNEHKHIHGTMAHGEKHGMCKINEEMAKFIKQNCKTNQRAWAKKLGISQPTISAIVVGRLWSHVDGK